MEKRILAIFDIDGTLLTNGMASRDAFINAFKSVTDTDDMEFDPQFAGMTDRRIFREMLSQCRREDDFDQLFPRWKEEFLGRLRIDYPNHPAPSLLPGVQTLLQTLQRHNFVALALGTGNTAESAEIKLARFGLWEYFETGGFGGDHEERANVIGAAMEQGRTICGPYDEAWVIGDTIHDVHAARKAGAKVLLVETGPRATAELDAVIPDKRLPDLSDLAAFFEALEINPETEDSLSGNSGFLA